MTKQELIEKYQKEIEELKECLSDKECFSTASEYFFNEAVKDIIADNERKIKDLEG